MRCWWREVESRRLQHVQEESVHMSPAWCRSPSGSQDLSTREVSTCAMSGTDLAYGAFRLKRVLRRIQQQQVAFLYDRPTSHLAPTV
eukprot:3937452-Rhodomonas_salina.3